MKKATTLMVAAIVYSVHAVAQGCAVCTKLAAGLDDKSAKGLNGGIVYLAFLPLMFIGSIGYIWWRRNRSAA